MGPLGRYKCVFNFNVMYLKGGCYKGMVSYLVAALVGFDSLGSLREVV